MAQCWASVEPGATQQPPGFDPMLAYAGPASTTLAQHYASIDPTLRAMGTSTQSRGCAILSARRDESVNIARPSYYKQLINKGSILLYLYVK